MKRIALKVWPYLACAIAGFGTYQWTRHLSGTLQSLVTNISAAFVAIPCLYLVYELSKSFSERRLNEEIFDYGKMTIDRKILRVINKLQKLIYPYEDRDSSLHGINAMLELDRSQLEGLFSNSSYLGFQVLKKWSVVENDLHNILENPFIIERFNDEQVITLIRIIKKIRHLESHIQADDLYISEGKIADGYRIQDGKSLNTKNKNYPDRYLLLKHIEEEKYVVVDFGDFERYKLDDLLKFHKVNPDEIPSLSNSVASLIDEVNKWSEKTGGEFVIDSQVMKIVRSDRVKRQEELTAN